MVMITSRKIIVGEKKLMKNDIGKRYCSVVVMLLCFDVKVLVLTYETTTNMTVKLKTDQKMTTYLGQYNFEP